QRHTLLRQFGGRLAAHVLDGIAARQRGQHAGGKRPDSGAIDLHVHAIPHNLLSCPEGGRSACRPPGCRQNLACTPNRYARPSVSWYPAVAPEMPPPVKGGDLSIRLLTPPKIRNCFRFATSRLYDRFRSKRA